MSGNNSPNNRFPLPENWDIDNVVCMVIPVPDDADYIAMMRGLIDTLTWQRSFNQHPTENAAYQVSKTWQRALDRGVTFQNCEAPMTLRQNPDNPCQLQQSFDDGGTWTLAFDYSLCSNVITVPAPYPGSDTGASDAAAAAMRNVFQALLNMVDCDASRENYINAATTYMRAFDAAYASPIALGAIYDAYCALDPDQKTEAKSDCPFLLHKDDLQDCADVNGLYDWLNCAAATINNWLNDTSDALMNALNQAAAALSGNGWQLASGGGSGGGASFGGDCLWQHEFSGAELCTVFTQTGVNYTGYHTGSCVPPLVADECHSYPGVGNQQQAWFIVELGNTFNFTDIILNYTTSIHEAGAIYIARLNHTGIYAEIQSAFINNGDTNVDYSFHDDTGTDIDALIVAIRTNTCAGNNQINSVTVKGHYPDPFA